MNQCMILVSLVFVVVPGLLAPGSSVAAPLFPINFVVLTDSDEAELFLSDAQIDREIEILNKRFVDSSGKSILRFEVKSVARYSDIYDSDCQILSIGDQHEKPPVEIRNEYADECDDPRVRDPEAINFYIFSSYYPDDEHSKTSYAGTLKPWVMINWDRMKTRYLAAQEHEMGHVFSLTHLAACGADKNTPTNIMAAEVGFCEGKPGDRSLGFNWFQIGQIKLAAQVIKWKLSQGN